MTTRRSARVSTRSAADLEAAAKSKETAADGAAITPSTKPAGKRTAKPAQRTAASKRKAKLVTTDEPSRGERTAAKSFAQGTEMFLPPPPPPETAPKTGRKRGRAKTEDDKQVDAIVASEADVEAIPNDVQTPKKRARKSASPTKKTPTAAAPTTPLKRSAHAHATNAPLQTPSGTRIVQHTQLPASSPDKNALTTSNLHDRAVAHLLAVSDDKLRPVIEAHPCPLFTPAGLAAPVNPFAALCSSVMGQQVSGAAAKSIKRKFLALFDDAPAPSDETAPEPQEDNDSAPAYFPTPSQVLLHNIPTLRSAGLSQRKAEYITGLASLFADGTLSSAKLLAASDAELLELLTAVRGLGRWSVEMFAVFALRRPDIFSTGDLGVQRGVAAYLGRDVEKLKKSGGGGGGGTKDKKWKYVGEKEMLETAEPFAPFRSMFMWYMWRVENVDVAVMS